MRIAAFLALIFALAASAGRAASCSVNVGWHVALASDAVDPDVFVWDSRPRLVDYAAGRWGNTHAVLAHTMLVQPGTEALVVACAPGAARPEYTSTVKDVVGVKILSGQFRGRYGWILADDAHPIRGHSR